VRLLQISVAGFGCLSDESISFSPTLNLIVGPNEAGKSTLQEAILASLYGLDGSDGGSPGTARWRPWTGAAFGLVLDAELLDGSRVRILRDWVNARLEVRDPRSDRDLMQRFGIHLEPGPALLGIARDVFTSTACISRAEIARIEDPSLMRRAVAELVEGGEADRSVQQALEALRKARLLECGDGAGAGPLEDARERFRRLSHDAAQAEQAREEMRAWAEQLQSITALSASDDQRGALLDLALARQRLQALEERQVRARHLDAELRRLETQLSELRAFASFPSALHPRALELRTRLDTASQEARAQREREAALQDQLASLKAQRTELEARARELEPAAGPAVMEGNEDEVRRLGAALGVVEAEIPTARERLQRRDAVARHAEARLEGYSLSANWEERRLVFHKSFSQWTEQSQAARDARGRMDQESADDLRSLHQDSERIKKASLVLDEIFALERAQPAMEEKIQRSGQRARTARMAILVLGVLIVLGFLLALYGLFETVPYYLGGLALGVGGLAGCIAAAVKLQDLSRTQRQLRREAEAAQARRQLLLEPFGVASGAELQQLQVDHLERVGQDAARLEIQRQLTTLEVRARESATALQRLVASWGLSVPSATDTSFQQTASLLERLVSDARTYIDAEQARVQARHALDELERQRDGLHARLREALRGSDGSSEHDLLTEADRFLARRSARRRLDQLTSQHEQVQAQLVRLDEPARRRAEAEAAGAEFQKGLRENYAAAGISTEDLEAAHAEWDRRLRGEAAFSAATSRAAQVRAELAHLLDGGTLLALDGQVDETRVAASAGSAQIDELAALADVPGETLERMRTELRQRCAARDQERLAIEHMLRRRWEELSDLASLREEAATAQQRVQVLGQRAAAFDLAIETLQAAAKAVRRDVARGLARELTPRLRMATQEQYSEAVVDEELAVRVRSATGRLIRVELLSQGTRNLIYLLERVSLAQWLGATKEPLPLLLDDALVHCDARRLEWALAVLEDLAQEAQILLFSKELALAEHPRIRRAWKVQRLEPRREHPAAHQLAAS